MNAHTPTPWRVGDAGHTIFGPLSQAPCPITVAMIPAPTPRCTLDERRANAAFICRAVNSHEALVAALKSCCELLNSPAVATFCAGMDLPVSRDVLRDACSLRISEIRAALALAEGRQS